MSKVMVTSRRAALATVLTGLGLLSGSLLGPTRPAPAAAAVSLPGWLAEPMSPPDPRTSTPADVAAFFTRLTPAQTAAFTTRYPEIVGNLDGAPVAVRYAANRARFPQSAGRQILAFDDRGDGLIAEVLGDLDTAERVAVLVPGVDTRLAHFDTGLGGVQRRALAWQARQLHDRIVATDPAARVAVVAWLGYDAPEGMGRATLRQDRAATGAAALDRFVDGLVLGRPGRSVVVVGHSYGSTVAGIAASTLSPQVTDVVAVGSPGMGVTGRAALHTGAEVWACAAPTDWIRRVPGLRVLGIGHGRLPSDPEFGARPLPCDDVRGHDGYFVPGSSALDAIAGIALDRPGPDPR